MPTSFRFEYDFRARAPVEVVRSYFEPELQAEQDRRVEVARREVVLLDDKPDTLHRVCKVVPRRQLPAIVRPFVPGELSYVEDVLWRKREDLLEVRIEPSILGGRVEILATYRVVEAGAGVCHRTYEGSVSVQMRVLGARIERGIVEDMRKSIETAAGATQEWLDRQP